MTEKLFEARNRAFSLLEKKKLDTGAVRYILEHVTGYGHAQLLANLQRAFTDTEQRQFDEALAKVLTGEPVQYVLGYEYFYGRIFQVNEHVLIPRPETEELVVEILNRKNRLFGEKPIHLADIGTGSGAIAVTLKCEDPKLNVTATDISIEALQIAKQNAYALDCEIDWRQGDLATPLSTQQWDIIVSNPPYIGEDEAIEMSETVLAHEPHTALFAAEDGLACYRKLAEQLPSMMKDTGVIGLEIGYQQGEAVQQLFQQAFPQANVEVIQDINGKDRMVFCEFTSL